MSVPRKCTQSYKAFLLEGSAEIGCSGCTLNLGSSPSSRGLSKKGHFRVIFTSSALAELTQEMTCWSLGLWRSFFLPAKCPAKQAKTLQFSLQEISLTLSECDKNHGSQQSWEHPYCLCTVLEWEEYKSFKCIACFFRSSFGLFPNYSNKLFAFDNLTDMRAVSGSKFAALFFTTRGNLF